MAILHDIFQWVRKAFGGEADEPEPVKQLPELPPMAEEEAPVLPPPEEEGEEEFTEGEPVEADPDVVLPPLEQFMVEDDGGFESTVDLSMEYPGPTDLDRQLAEIKELLHREDEPRQLYDDSVGGLQRVEVEQTGGVAGSSAANCTWTYTINLPGGDTLAAGLTPKCSRFPLTEYNIAQDASPGLAYIDGNGDWVLYHVAQEIPKTDLVVALTSFNIDDGTNKIQYKTTSFRVLEKAAESGWTDYTGDACP